MLFCEINGLDVLENNKNWRLAIELIYTEWIKNKQSTPYTIRLLAECWLVLTNAAIINISTGTYNYAKSTLLEAFHYLIKSKIDNENKLILGYLICFEPAYFCNDYASAIEYTDMANYGNDLLQSAYLENANDMLFATIYYGSNNINSQKYNHAKKQLQPSLQSLFSNKTAIERYFLECLTI